MMRHGGAVVLHCQGLCILLLACADITLLRDVDCNIVCLLVTE